MWKKNVKMYQINEFHRIYFLHQLELIIYCNYGIFSCSISISQIYD